MSTHAAAGAVDVAIIGAGIAGLWLARNLSHLGLSVLLVDREHEVGSGSTTRNEGWLHRGTYFLASIAETPLAMRVAEQVAYGYHAIWSLYPEVLDQLPRSYAFTRSADLASKATCRWSNAGVPFEEVSRQSLIDLEPRLTPPSDAVVFGVEDASIDTSRLCARLLQDALSRGMRLELGVQIERLEECSVVFQSAAGRYRVEAKWVIHATGYGMRESLETVAGIDLPIRLWKSHLLDFPRLFTRNVFSIDPRGINVFHHDKWSIVGLNTETGRCPLERPEFQTDAAVVDEILTGVNLLVRDVELSTYQSRACVKVDRFRDQRLPQLDADWGFLGANQIWVLPGKLTAAPYVAREISNAIYHGSTSRTPVAQRPIDRVNARAASLV